MKRILVIVLTTISYMVQTTMADTVDFRTKELKRLATKYDNEFAATVIG